MQYSVSSATSSMPNQLQDVYDVAIVGGGIYGLMLWMESTRRGLRSVLIEQDTLASGISNNSFRTIHGGLRHLQRADLVKFYEGVRERKWFLQHFPEHTLQRRFLMPLSGRGINRRFIMRIVSLANNALTQLMVGDAGVDRAGTLEHNVQNPIPLCDRVQQAVFFWHDGEVTDVSGFARTVARINAGYGAGLQEQTQVTAVDRVGDHYNISSNRQTVTHSRVVLDTTAMWPSDHSSVAPLEGHYPSLAWNIVTDVPAIAEDAIVLTAGDGTTLFLRNERGRLYIGTGHAGLENHCDQTQAQAEAAKRLPAFLLLVNETTGLQVTEANVTRIEAGVLPVANPGSVNFASRALIDMDQFGACYRVSGVKLTSARAVADSLVAKIARQHFGKKHPLDYATFFAGIKI